MPEENKIYCEYYGKHFSIAELEEAFSLYNQHIKKNGLSSEFEEGTDDVSEEWFYQLGDSEVSHILYHAEMEGFVID